MKQDEEKQKYDHPRIYVRKEAHQRYKRWAVLNGHTMLEALGYLMDQVEGRSKNK